MSRPARCGAALLAAALVVGCASTDAIGDKRQSRTLDPSSSRSATMTTTPSPTRASREEIRLVNDFVAFAVDPRRSTAQGLPLSPAGVGLGLGQNLVRDLPRGDEGNPASWRIAAGTGFRGYVGPFSALRTIREHTRGRDGDSGLRKSGDLAVSVGPHPHCASPPVSAPSSLEEMRRISIQPAEHAITSCLAWFTVDLFLDSDRRIVAVTLDLWEP